MEETLIYLRKSRLDRDTEKATGKFDTLQRHRTALLDLAKRMGLTVSQIFEEVVSGDTISDRPEMQNLLAAVETGRYYGVLVMEVARLARGNTRDQGVVAETFQYTGTKIITPDKIYDPADESDEEYFEFGLFMSRREYKTINRRLQRGRMASLNEGKYIASDAPYGYEKFKLKGQRGYSLRPNPQEAAVVQNIFQYYIYGLPQSNGDSRPMGSYTIALQLNAQGITSPGGGQWSATSVRDIIKNPVYAGFVRWSYRHTVKQMQGGLASASNPVNKAPKIVPGLHPAIIDEKEWQRAQNIIQERSHPSISSKSQISNPLAGILFCSVCGRSILRIPPRHPHLSPFLTCPTPKCETMGSTLDVAEAAVLDCIRDWLSNYEMENGPAEPGSGFALLRHTQDKFTKLGASLASLNLQRGRLFDFLERGIYTEEVFLERSRALAARITETEAALADVEEDMRIQKRAFTQQSELIPKMRRVLAVYNTLESPAQKNALLKEVVQRIVYSKNTGGRWQPSNLNLFLFPRLTPDS